MTEWERVSDTRYSATTRMAVPGGWIYRVLQDGVGVALCFVPISYRDGKPFVPWTPSPDYPPQETAG